MTKECAEKLPVAEQIITLLMSDAEIVDKVKLKPGELPVKIFAPRNSLLTDMFEVKHIRTFYNMFLAAIVCLFVNSAAYNYLKKNEVHLGFRLIIKGFGRIHIALVVWSCIFLSSLLIYIGFKYWAIVRTRLTPKSKLLKVWDYLCLTTFVIYYPSLMYFSVIAIYKCELSLAESLAILMETARFIMKIHAFVRSNAPRVIKYKLHTEDQVLYPQFSKFIYFSFAPTLIYQDSYPRSARTRWNFAAVCFLEVFVMVLFISFIIEKFYVSAFENYGLKPYSWQDIIILILETTAIDMLGIMAAFYLLLHAWMNAFAELLRFSDRMFYKDWWTSTSYGRYYRTWNVVVHDWLYTYIYKDFYEIIVPKNKFVAKCMVFFASAVIHEYLGAFIFKFFMPIMYILFFGCGIVLSSLKIKNEVIGNVFLLYTFALGTSIISCFYAMEYFSRINCPIENPTMSSYLIPRMFSCYK